MKTIEEGDNICFMALEINRTQQNLTADEVSRKKGLTPA